SRAFSVTRLPSYSQCVHAPCFPTRRSSDLRLRVVPRGGRRARGGRRPVRRRGALGPPPRHFPPVYGPASPVRGLLHGGADLPLQDRKSTRLNSSHEWISYAAFCSKNNRLKL